MMLLDCIRAIAGFCVVIAVVCAAGEIWLPWSPPEVEGPQRGADNAFVRLPKTPPAANLPHETPRDVCVFLRSSIAARGIHGDPDPRFQRVDYLTHGPNRFEDQPLLAADIPGNSHPELLPVEDVHIPPKEDVIGVAVQDEYHAYLIEALSLMQDHVVNQLIANVPISVTYCNLADCVRVLTTTESHRPIDLRIGGLLNARTKPEVVLLLAGKRYRQNARGLPLQDHAFVRTSWGEWSRAHPRTVVFIGEMNRYRRKSAVPETQRVEPPPKNTVISRLFMNDHGFKPVRTVTTEQRRSS